MKIGLLIPTTTNKRDEWTTVKDTYLYTILINSFIVKCDKEHDYTFYIGYDKGDRIFSQKTERDKITNLSKVFKYIKFDFTEFENIQKGHVTVMWNQLFKKAYDEGCDYFFQTGDDVKFLTNGWVNDCIKTLQAHNDVGLTGPINNNPRILTQSFVSRKHMDIFGFYMPEEILNWGCDDWYNQVYKPSHFFPLIKHFASNDGGEPRYVINNDNDFTKCDQFHGKLYKLRKDTEKMAIKDRMKLISYLSSQ
jgi:hypothetical protein